jgi:hypothetical protein
MWKGNNIVTKEIPRLALREKNLPANKYIGNIDVLVIIELMIEIIRREYSAPHKNAGLIRSGYKGG